jgi:hypothetical protein
VLAYGFTENLQFGAKIDRNSILLGCDPHITDRLSIMVKYMNFNRFQKNSNFCSKSISVTVQFSWKSPVWGKQDLNSVFLDRDHNIVDRLSITVSYMNFYGFWFFLIFRSKFIAVSLRFYRKSSVWGKTDRNSIFLYRNPIL